MQSPPLSTTPTVQQLFGLFQKSIRCTLPNCTCQCFEPGTKTASQIRVCDACHHSWVVHALDKLRVSNPYQMAHAEPVTSSSAFDVASLALYGTRAVPIRVKLLLDRIFAQLPPDHLLQLLARLNWSHDDYIRGYMQIDAPTGNPIDRWIMATRDEEAIIIQQFFRFAETKSIAHELLLQDAKDRQESFQQAMSLHSAVGGADSHIRRFLEASVSGGSQNVLQASAIASALAGTSIPGGLPGLVAAQALAANSSLLPSVVVATAPITQQQQTQPQQTPQPLATNNRSSSTTRQSLPASETLSTGPLNLTKKDRNFTTAPCSTPSSQNFKSAHSNSTELARSIADEDSSQRIVMPEAKSVVTSVAPPRPSNGSSGSIDRSSYGYGGTIVSPTTGKKRVLCQACGKTFCDKGALKIHYSAVHLREMHRCSIQGCNMYFSSRRSRNRHSANPNPKLHSPFRQRVVIDGRPVGGDGASVGPSSLAPSASGIFEDNDASSTSELRRQADANNSVVSESDERELASSNLFMDEEVDEDVEAKDEAMDAQEIQNFSSGLKRNSVAVASHSDDENGMECSNSSMQEGFVAVSAAPGASKRRKSAIPVRVVRFCPEDAEGEEFQMGEISRSQSPTNLRVASPTPSSTSSQGGTNTVTSDSIVASGDQHVEPAIEIPVDPSNPRQCPSCKKLFQNPFSMRLHYQNVHLKVMHYCTVAGCNAVFPSKRSRDRHASNANLHRRISSGGTVSGLDLSGALVSPTSMSPSDSVDASNAITSTPSGGHNSTSVSSNGTDSPVKEEANETWRPAQSPESSHPAITAV